MIWKKSDAEEPAVPAQPAPPPPPAVKNQPQATRERALIGPSIEFKGNLTGGEDLLIEGRIEGRIELRQHSVTIGKNGRVKADVYGRAIIVHGEVDGNLFGEEQIVLRQASTVRGNLQAPRVTLEDGSQFKGSIDMAAKPAVEVPPQRASTPAEPRPSAPPLLKQEKTVERS